MCAAAQSAGGRGACGVSTGHQTLKKWDDRDNVICRYNVYIMYMYTLSSHGISHVYRISTYQLLIMYIYNGDIKVDIIHHIYTLYILKKKICDM